VAGHAERHPGAIAVNKFRYEDLVADGTIAVVGRGDPYWVAPRAAAGPAASPSGPRVNRPDPVTRGR
jgi:hypothetical protein